MKSKDRKKAHAAAGDNARNAVAESVATAAEVADKIVSFVGPKVADARERVEPLVVEAVERSATHLADAAEKMAPYCEKTRDAVIDSYDKKVKPRIQEFVDKASENEYVARAARKGSEAMGNLKSKIDPPVVTAPPKKKHRLLKGLGIAALVGAVILTIRHLLLPKDDGWTPQEPSVAYTEDQASDTPENAAPRRLEDESAQTGSDDEDGEAEEAEVPLARAGATEKEEPQEGVARAETVDAEPTALDEANDSHESTVGFRGENPPEGFTIKGNERSMKFHIPGSGGYSRTNADVWFKTVEEAESAGFTKASR